MRSKVFLLIAVLLSTSLLSGCVRFKSKRGVAVAWQAEVVDKLKVGASTRTDVLDLLGPPSQVISLADETVLYYLFEKAQGEGIILIVYNSITIDTNYDRAIFFFDENNVMTDVSTRIHRQDSE